MKARRDFLTLLGAWAAGLAGCGSTNSSPSTPTETLANNTTDQGTSEETQTEEGTETDDEPEISQREQSIQEGLPLEGLGAYENQMLEAGPVEESTAEEIENLLEGADSPEEEADALDDMLTTGNYGPVMAEFYRQKESSENTVVVNANETNATDGNILEILPVQNAELQGQPNTSDTYNGKVVETNKPGETDPEYLAQLRETNAARMVPQDHDSFESGIEFMRSDDRYDEEDIETFRAGFMEQWSAGLFGVDDSHNIIPHGWRELQCSL